jgi:site-specific DNA-methyltransferase (adenine-specific)
VKATIQHIDLLTAAPKLEPFDHTITDPPYLQDSHENQRRGESSRRGRGHVERPLNFDHLTPELRAEYAHAIVGLTRRWGIVFSDHWGCEGWRTDLAAAGALVVRQLCWVRGSIDVYEGRRVTKGRKGAPQFTGDRPAVGHEVMILFHAAGTRMRWNGRGARRDGTRGLTGGGTVYYADIETEGRIHDTQKPLALMRELVRDFTLPGESIFDPFAGSGTTMVAARCEGRSSVGLEANARAASAAAKRLG